MKRLLKSLLLLPLLVLLLGSAAAHADAPHFYQPQDGDAALSQAQWQQLWQDTRAAGVEQILVQWTRQDVSDFGGADGWLLQALAAAEEAGLELVLGLYYPSDYYARMGDSDNARYHWHRWLAASLEQARWLRQHSQLQPLAWYLPMELDDALLRDPGLRRELNKQLAAFTARVDRPVHVSAFSAGRLTPEVYARWLADVPVARVWWQDGRGTGALDEQVRGAYEAALDCRIGIVREAFAQTSGPDQPFSAEPAMPKMTTDCHEQAVFSLRYRPWAGVLLRP